MEKQWTCMSKTVLKKEQIIGLRLYDFRILQDLL